MTATLDLARKNPPFAAAALIIAIGAIALASVYYIQYVELIAPCPLCLEQRVAYYTSMPLAALLLLGASHGANRKVLLLGFLAIAGIMLWNTGLSAFHAGVEWKWWAGPLDCSGPINKIGSTQSLINQLQRISLVRCDEASWRLFGLSLAGYDVFASLGLAAVAAWGAWSALRRP
jgi:disulfide bond formation protein DsbB